MKLRYIVKLLARRMHKMIPEFKEMILNADRRNAASNIVLYPRTLLRHRLYYAYGSCCVVAW